MKKESLKVLKYYFTPTNCVNHLEGGGPWVGSQFTFLTKVEGGNLTEAVNCHSYFSLFSLFEKTLKRLEDETHGENQRRKAHFLRSS